MPTTTDVLGDAAKAVKNFEKNGVPYEFKYDDKSLYIFGAVLAFLIVVVVVSTAYFKTK